MIKMSKEILDVINAVLAYKRFYQYDGWAKNENRMDFFEKTKEYYYSLELPNGMEKNNTDFELIISYGVNEKELNKLNNISYSDLQYECWRK